MYELCVVRIPEKVRVSFERLYLLCAFGVIEIVLLLPRSFAVPGRAHGSCMGSCRFDFKGSTRDGPRCTAGTDDKRVHTTHVARVPYRHRVGRTEVG
jgi:hypothetical protein